MMDRRSWPWKKKPSEKALAAADLVSASLSTSTGPQTEQDDAKSVKYVQISVESYIHLSGLQDLVKTLNEKLSSAQSEMIIKDNLVKQHAKVAEEAVSGWEKAEAEALALKQQLENTTLLKLAAEERSSHLDGAIKECMKQLRNVKEESEVKLHDVIITKTKQWEIVRADLEEKLHDFEQELLKASADNSILSRSLQERSNLLMKFSEEKSQADAQIEVLKSNIESCEREISSIKYELHVVTKELEIRNEEKNMSVRSAEVANRQHLEDVKKITKLEAECQRLRGLVRKKLPGPAALAQMKLEVENLGREYGDNRLRWSPAKGSNAQPFDTTLENFQQVQKENEFLSAQILAMEEEMKMLKEALSDRNSELQASRKICSKHANKLRNMEAHLLLLNQQKSHSKFSTDVLFENESNPPSLTSISEDGIDEETNYSDSRATAVISELSHYKKDKEENSHYLELMDDFLEMERLACLSTEVDKDMNRSDGVKLVKEDTLPMDHCLKKGDAKEENNANSESLSNSTADPASKVDIPFLKLKSSILSTFDSHVHESNVEKILEDFDHIIQDAREALPRHSFVIERNGFTEDVSEQSSCQQDVHEIIDVGISSRNNCVPCTKFNNVSDQDLKNAIAYVHGFLVSLCKGVAEIQANSSTGIIGKRKKIEEFSDYIDRVIRNKISLHDFLLDLTRILHEACNLRFLLGTWKGNEGESNSADFIDKETLLENQVTQHKETLLENEGSLDAGFRIQATCPAFSFGDFENLKLEKEKVEEDLARCNEMLNQTKSTLAEVDQQLSEFKSELASCQKSNRLAETQLKCMAESYKMLERRNEELEAEVGHWRAKAETLDSELQLERRSHQDNIVKYNELQVQIERNRKCSTSSFPYGGVNTKTQQEREIEAAAEKLAECQENIIHLGRQLHAMRNPAEQMDSSTRNSLQLIDFVLKDERNAGCLKPPVLFSPLHPDHTFPENLITSVTEYSSRESPLNGYNSHMNLSDTEQTPFSKSPITPRHQKQKVYRSSSSSSPSNALPEKHGRGFRKLFSRGKGE
ncbi:filament-like plant protein 4 [Dendrobium catenatum]|uniref:Filament-like plant protein 4 n=1 Tax=Dendrobium catenatum TaxID=906689 RepID=A0A2I0WYM8_9ASPA|nr:filament-like plant protein 4 [Dendrobium catenatum]PKU80770.1 Filament-like plant protein 4 [Dendrobium catenatum]